VIDRQLLYNGYLGTVIGISYSNEVRFLCRTGPENYRWSDYDCVLEAGPTLLFQGRKLVMPRAQGFTSRVHFSKHIRAAVGITRSNKLVFVTSRRRITLSQLAGAMKALGCTDAAVLDGGSSTGLYCKGKLIDNPAGA